MPSRDCGIASDFCVSAAPDSADPGPFHLGPSGVARREDLRLHGPSIRRLIGSARYPLMRSRRGSSSRRISASAHSCACAAMRERASAAKAQPALLSPQQNPLFRPSRS